MQSLRRQHHQQFALWLAIAAILLRALIPDGFMPERDRHGSLSLAFCYAGPLAGLRGHDHAGHGAALPGEHSADSHDCAFAAVAGPGLPAALPQLPLAIAAAAALPRLISVFAAGAAPRLRPPSRAPPANL